MKQFILTMPDGQNYEISDFEEFRQKIMPDAEYLLQYTAEASNDDAKLKMLFRNGRTALIYFNTCEGFWYSLSEKADISEIIKKMSFRLLPEELFLPEELAWKIIRKFMETGTMSEEIEWLEGNLLKHFMMECPNGEDWQNPDLNALYHAMIIDYMKFWCDNNGEAIIRYYQGKADWGKRDFCELIAKADCTDDEMIFLEYFNKEKDFYSLYDDTKLSVPKMSLIGDEYSAGLFLPKESAWLAIKEFLETGKPSEKISWIPLEELEKIEGARY